MPEKREQDFCALVKQLVKKQVSEKREQDESQLSLSVLQATFHGVSRMGGDTRESRKDIGRFSVIGQWHLRLTGLFNNQR